MMLNQLLDKKNQVAIAILMVVPMVILYRMIFFGEIVGANDQLERYPINQWRDTYLENNSEFPQWFPNLFSGMPSFGGYIYTPGDPTRPLQDLIFFNKGIKYLEYVLFNIFDKFKKTLLFFNIEIENFSVLVSKDNIFIFIIF